MLEVQLGTSLMVKVGRRIALTEAGERHFASITDEIERIAEATSHVRGFRSVLALNVRATPTLSHKRLLPRLASFLDAHPDMEVRLDGTNEPTDFDRESVDIEVRHGDGRWPGLFVEGLAEEQFWPVCAPGYAGPHSLNPSDLPDRRLIHSVKSQAQWIVCPRDHLRQSKVRLFLDWLRGERDAWQARQAAGDLPQNRAGSTVPAPAALA